MELAYLLLRSGCSYPYDFRQCRDDGTEDDYADYVDLVPGKNYIVARAKEIFFWSGIGVYSPGNPRGGHCVQRPAAGCLQ